MVLRYAKAEDIRYSIADEEQFRYLITRLRKDEQEAFEEIGGRIRNSADKKITKKEIQEIFQKHTESAYRGDLINLNQRLKHILKDLVDDDGLKVEVAERKPVVSKTGLKKVGDTFQGSETFGGTKMDIALSMKGEFFKHAMGEESYIGKIKDNWSIDIPVRIARFMGLEGGMSFKLGWEGDSLALTPLKETEMPMKIQLSGTVPQKASLRVGIPADMLFIAGLKLGDYAAWSEKDGLLCLRKAEKDAPYARKIQWVGIGRSISAGTTIPAEMAEKAHVEPGRYGFWTFEDLNKSLWLEVGGTRDIAKITKVEREGGARFSIYIPKGMRGKLEKGDEVVLEVKDGKLYVTKY